MNYYDNELNITADMKGKAFMQINAGSHVQNLLQNNIIPTPARPIVYLVYN